MILTSSNHPGDLPYLGVPENNRYGAPLHKVGSNTQGEAENVDNTCYKIYIFQSQLYCGEVPLIPTDVAELGLTEKVTIFLLTLEMYIVYHKRAIRL